MPRANIRITRARLTTSNGACWREARSSSRGISNNGTKTGRADPAGLITYQQPKPLSYFRQP